MRRVKIVIVDDHFLVRVGLKSLFATPQVDITVDVVGEASCAEELYTLLGSGISVDLVLLDIILPGESGIEIAKRLISDYPELKILMLSAEASAEILEQVAEMEVAGFISKTVSNSELYVAIESAYSGVEYYGRDIAKLMHNIKIARSEVDDSIFTPKESEVLKLAAEGYYSKEIADKMSISDKTVSVHKSNIFRKLGISNSVELVRYAIRTGLIKP